jgi:hypothetical protein
MLLIVCLSLLNVLYVEAFKLVSAIMEVFCELIHIFDLLVKKSNLVFDKFDALLHLAHRIVKHISLLAGI